MAKGFTPTLFDKLFDSEPRIQSEANTLRRLNIEELKESIAADLETLLNCRRGYTDEQLRPHARVAESILSFGITDFVGLSLSNPADCHRICREIEQTILRHEKRLRSVRVTLESDRYSTNTLRFCIHAVLMVYPAREPVNFDALLQPTTQQYSVSRGWRQT